MRKKPTILIVLDGWGVREEQEHNAIAQAHTPFYDHLWSHYPHTILDASEGHVGLPEGQIGNSEVGHMTIGAGKVIDIDLIRINKTIENGEFDTNPVFEELFNHVKKYQSALHVIGLTSFGGVHSHQEHLHAFLKLCKNKNIENVVIHAFTDGRDTPPQSSGEYLKQLEQTLEDTGVGFIATATGRYFAMDRDKNWDRVKKAEDAIFHGKGKTHQNIKPSEALKRLHQEGALDEYMEPVIFLDNTGKSYSIQKDDGIFYFNFRTDRGRELSEKILERKQGLNLCLVTMTEYNEKFDCLVAFPPIKIESTLAGEVSKAGLVQAHIAETEKYAHATYFLNGGKQEPYAGEEHVMIDTKKDVPTHDLAPEMRAKEIADTAIEQIKQGKDFIFINFANADVVGHTANQPAIKKAVECVDAQLKRIVEASEKHEGLVFITADHGNAEINIDPITGEKHTAHTLSRVPAIITQEGLTLHPGTLADIAPTILKLMELPQPQSMTGKSLIDKQV